MKTRIQYSSHSLGGLNSRDIFSSVPSSLGGGNLGSWYGRALLAPWVLGKFPSCLIQLLVLLGILGLWPHQSDVYNHHHQAFSLCLCDQCPSSCKDITLDWVSNLPLMTSPHSITIAKCSHILRLRIWIFEKDFGRSFPSSL